MTVHGAKGLEAPIVILADTTTNPAGPRPPRLLTMPASDGAPASPERLVWARAQGDRCSARCGGARQRRAGERGRVSPPALCRDDARRRPPDRVRRRGPAQASRRAAGTISCAMRSSRSPARRRGPNGEAVWRLRKWPEPAEAGTAAAGACPGHGRLPDWLTRPAAAERVPAIVSPSTAIAEPAPVRLRGQPRRASRRAPARRAGASADAVAARCAGGAPRRRGAAVSRARRHRLHRGRAWRDRRAGPGRAGATRRFAPAGRAGSRAEVPIVGRIARDGRPPDHGLGPGRPARR